MTLRTVATVGFLVFLGAETGICQGRGDVEFYRNLQEFEGRLDAITWDPAIDANERTKVIQFVESIQGKYVLTSLTNVIAADLDNDGDLEMVLNVAIRNPTEANFGDSMVVLDVEPGGALKFALEVPPLSYALVARRFSVVDFDADGDLDIVDQQRLEAYGEDPSVDATVYQAETISSVTPVFRSAVFDFVEFQQLDADPEMELLEPVLGVERRGLIVLPSLWVNVLDWTGSEFVQSNTDHLDFFQSKQADFTTLRDEAEAAGGPFASTLVGIYEEYLDMIAQLIGHP